MGTILAGLVSFTWSIVAFWLGHRAGRRDERRWMREVMGRTSARVPTSMSEFGPIATRHVDQRAILNDHLTRHIRGGRGN